jgi:hypothetical protein
MDMGDEVSSRSPLFCGAVHDDSLPQRFVNVRCESRCELLLKSVEPCAEVGLGTADTVLSEGKLADRVVDEGKHGRTVSFSDTVVSGDNTLGQMSSMAQTCVRTQDFAPTEAILRSAKTVRDVLHEQDGAMPSYELRCTGSNVSECDSYPSEPASIAFMRACLASPTHVQFSP